MLLIIILYSPSSLDVCMAAHIAVHLHCPVRDNFLATMLRDKFPTLTLHAKTLLTANFDSFDDATHIGGTATTSEAAAVLELKQIAATTPVPTVHVPSPDIVVRLFAALLVLFCSVVAVLCSHTSATTPTRICIGRGRKGVRRPGTRQGQGAQAAQNHHCVRRRVGVRVWLHTVSPLAQGQPSRRWRSYSSSRPAVMSRQTQ
jgi:hypothetical protein